MDADFRIYMAAEEDIPAEDKARLEGFLKGREEADMKDEIARLKAEMRELEDRHGD